MESDNSSRSFLQLNFKVHGQANHREERSRYWIGVVYVYTKHESPSAYVCIHLLHLHGLHPRLGRVHRVQYRDLPFPHLFLTHKEAVEFHGKTGPKKWSWSGYRHILNEFRDAVVTTFGQEIECQDRQKRVAFRMKLAYDFTDIASIEPVMTREFDNFEEIIME